MGVAADRLPDLYWAGQPLLNRSFGWNLPSLASLLNGTPPAEAKPDRPQEKTPPPRVVETSPRRQMSLRRAVPQESSDASESTSFLTTIGRERYRSPAGLIYTWERGRASFLKHIAKHLSDQPNRPGSHGVFDGDLDVVLRLIDDAYRRALRGDRSTKTPPRRPSTIYEVTFERPIGYVGGQDGKRKKNPTTKRMRLVVIDQKSSPLFLFDLAVADERTILLCPILPDLRTRALSSTHLDDAGSSDVRMCCMRRMRGDMARPVARTAIPSAESRGPRLPQSNVQLWGEMSRWATAMTCACWVGIPVPGRRLRMHP